MIYGSVCSGIEAATVAWSPLGWKPAFFAEIAPFPSRVLAHHYPEVKNYGDFTTIRTSSTIDVLIGGTPCQSFSVAGRRLGLDDPRGNLAIEFLRLAQRVRARWLVWENVPGVLSSNGGRDFGAFLGLLGECGYGWTYRVLDAQYFGVAQSRKRVFVVGYLGDWRPPCAVLFELESLLGDSTPRGRAKYPDTTVDERQIGAAIAHAVTTREGQRMQPRAETYVINARQDPVGSDQVSPCLQTQATMAVASGGEIRRITPIECERLQGFPDGYTDIPGATDSKRYHALGNSMAVPVIRWIGERIDAADRVTKPTTQLG